MEAMGRGWGSVQREKKTYGEKGECLKSGCRGGPRRSSDMVHLYECVM